MDNPPSGPWTIEDIAKAEWDPELLERMQHFVLCESCGCSYRRNPEKRCLLCGEAE